MTKRGQSKASPDLEVLIEAANRPGLPDLDEKFWQATGNNFRLPRFIKVLPSETRKFLGNPSNADQFRDRYDALRCAKLILPSLAETLAEIEQRLDQRRDYESSGWTSMPSIPVNLYVRNDDVLAASGTFVNAIAGVRKSQIRQCAVCSSIFWAKRENSACCEKCRKMYNQRNSRKARKNLAKKRDKGAGGGENG